MIASFLFYKGNFIILLNLLCLSHIILSSEPILSDSFSNVYFIALCFHFWSYTPC
uniref:Uncharacterized protein n=1 Tax=Rhizophora mucronata TaxID=61149 RepID=A0A2P2PDF9_RHIMU